MRRAVALTRRTGPSARPPHGRLPSISRPSRAAMTSSGSIGSWLPELPTSSARWSRTWTDRSGPTASSTVTGPSWPGARSAASSRPSGPGERLRPIWAARKRRASSTCRSRLARRTMYSRLPNASRLRPSSAPYQSTRRKRSDGATEKRSPRRPVTPAPDRPIASPLPQGVAGPTYGLDEAGFAAGLELLAQGPNVDVDDIRLAQEVVAPNALEDQVAGEHLAGMAHQELEQLVLAGGQLDPAIAAADLARAGVELQVGQPKDLRPVRRRSAQERPHSGDQLVEDERLGQV